MTIVKLAFTSWFRVRGGMVGPLVFLTLMFLVEGSFWTSLGKSSGVIGPYSTSDALLYALLALIVYQITACAGEPDSLSEKIESGTLDGYLLKPASYITQMLQVQAGLCLARALALLPLIVACQYWIHGRVLWAPCLVIAPVFILAGAINFIINHCLALFTFYWRESYALVVFKETLFWVLSGTLIPLDLFPAAFAKLFQALPASLVVFYPAKVLMNQKAAWEVLTHQTVALVLLLALASFLWAKSLKKYQAYGG